ncbi:MAG: nucleotidyl transferase AbiEii/AbiGii toxin family protein [Pseudomonadota bacterium]
MFKVRLDRPLSGTQLALLHALDEVAKQLAIPYFVVGASARDILLEHVHGIETIRATSDIDFAVAIASWDDYERLTSSLTTTGQFFRGANPHQLKFGAEEGPYSLDLVPFDGIEQDGEIAWPPNGDFVMNVRGYADALYSALDIEIEPGFQIKVVSLPAMVILKVLAWNDRPERDNHPSDVLFVLRNYHQAGQFDRLYDEAFEQLEKYGYEIELAGAALLGQDARRDIAQEARTQVTHVLANERAFDKFCSQARRTSLDEVDDAKRLLRAFLDNIV